MCVGGAPWAGRLKYRVSFRELVWEASSVLSGQSALGMETVTSQRSATWSPHSHWLPSRICALNTRDGHSDSQARGIVNAHHGSSANRQNSARTLQGKEGLTAVSAKESPVGPSGHRDHRSHSLIQAAGKEPGRSRCLQCSMVFPEVPHHSFQL